MFILIFNRRRGDYIDESWLLGTHDTLEDAQKHMRGVYHTQMHIHDGLKLSYIEDNQAFLSTFDGDMTVRLLIFDTDRPWGYTNRRHSDWARMHAEK